MGYSLAAIFGLPVAGASLVAWHKLEDAWASAAVAQAFICPETCEIFAAQGLNLCPLPWQILFFFVKENLLLIGGELLYNIVLISAMHQHESATSTHTHVPSRLPPHPTLLSCHRAPV